MTYAGRPRREQEYTVSKVGEGSVEYEGGTGHGMFDALRGRIKPGDRVVMETVNFSMITGVRPADSDQWFFRKTDDDLDREHREMMERFERERQERLAANRDEWQRRTDALPDWVRERIVSFQRSGGEKFEADGWGYELVIAELATLYTPDDGFADNDAVMDVARREGTSGNQHEFAKALAKAHHAGQGLGGTVSALSPITGDADYSGDR